MISDECLAIHFDVVQDQTQAAEPFFFILQLLNYARKGLNRRPTLSMPKCYAPYHTKSCPDVKKK